MTKMKLTKYDKECFVNEVMADVPQIDYQAQANSICMEWAIKRLPAEVALVYKKFPGWIENRRVWMPGSLSAAYVPLLENMINLCSQQPELHARLVVLSDALSAQYEARKVLKEQVEAVIYGCSTLKQATERLPEFEKYLPVDRAYSATANLPATANLVTDLMKAGWPKGEVAANTDTLVEAA